jgi:16S rRNA G1207 methylase RsmC
MADFIDSKLNSCDSTIIDVGCGKGYLSFELAEKLSSYSSEQRPLSKFILVDGN